MHCINKKYFVAILLFLSVVLPKAHLQASEIWYFYDSFTDNINSWNLSEDSRAPLSINNGHFNFQHTRKEKSYFVTKQIPLMQERDFRIEASIKKVGGYLKNGYGLVWGRNIQSNQQYEFHVIGSGYYRILKMINGKNIFIEKGKASDAVHAGNGVKNKLTLIKKGNQMSFFVNDTKVHTTKFEPLFGNYFGFIIYKDQTIAVDYLSIDYLDDNYSPKLKKDDQDLVQLANMLPDSQSKKYMVAAADQAKKSKWIWTITQVRLSLVDSFIQNGMYLEAVDVLNNAYNRLEAAGNIRNMDFILNKGPLFGRIAKLSGILKNKTKSSSSLLNHIQLLQTCALERGVAMLRYEGRTADLADLAIIADENNNETMADKTISILANNIERQMNNPKKREFAYAKIFYLQSIPRDMAQERTIYLLNKLDPQIDDSLYSSKRIEVAEMAYAAKGDSKLIRSILQPIQPDRLSASSKFTYYWLLKEIGAKNAKK